MIMNLCLILKDMSAMGSGISLEDELAKEDAADLLKQETTSLKARLTEITDKLDRVSRCHIICNDNLIRIGNRRLGQPPSAADELQGCRRGIERD